MPPMIAAPATKWSQSASSSLSSADVLGVARRRRGNRGCVSNAALDGPYFEKLSRPTTSWPAASSSSTR